MFAPGENYQNNLSGEIWNLEQSYKIKSFDLLEIKVVNKGGEILIDPEFQTRANNTTSEIRENIRYRVDSEGFVRMPMVGRIPLQGLTIDGAEELIYEKFLDKYDQPYVQVKFLNKRAFLLGATGGHVIPLNEEGSSLAEVLALGGGVDVNGRVDNIRLIRDNEIVFIDLSSIEGVNMVYQEILPNDIIYVEHVRRPVAESLREYNPLIGFISGIVSITALILSTQK